MIQTIDRHTFRQAFNALRPNNFTPAGQDALYDYLEQLEDDTGTPIELDVIALCCEFTEYSSLADFQADYDADQYETVDDIRNDTTVIEIPDTEGFIIQQF